MRALEVRLGKVLYPTRLTVATAVAEVAHDFRLTSSEVELASLRAQVGVIPILGSRTADQLADNLTCLDVDLPLSALVRLDQASHVPRGFPDDFLAADDHILGGMSDQLDLPFVRTRHG